MFSLFTGKAPDSSLVKSAKAEVLLFDMDDAGIAIGYDSNGMITSFAVTGANKILRLGYQESGQTKVGFNVSESVKLHTGSEKPVTYENMTDIVILQELSLAVIQELIDTRLGLIVCDPRALAGVSTAGLGASDDLVAGDVYYIVADVSCNPKIERTFGQVQKIAMNFKKNDMDKLIDGIGEYIAVSISA
jgi:hypothetical protein